MCPVHFSYEDSITGHLTANECIAILKNYDELKKLTNERESIVKTTKTAINVYYGKKMLELINAKEI